ncbi:MAG: AAA family ATPase [Sedimenticola sp.]
MKKHITEDTEVDTFLENVPVLPEMGVTSEKDYTVEIQSRKSSTEDYLSTVRSFNNRYKQLFEMILSWCRKQVFAMKNDIKEPPFYTFVTGGAGTGKCHLIRTIVKMVDRELRPICNSPDKYTVLTMAPTGIAALNIDGTTIHQALSIPVNVKENDYPPVSHEKMASLRNVLDNLYLVIIDEMSMVSLQLLALVHKRLQDIRGVYSPDIVFGGYRILAIGDLYQLEPVRQKAVYALPTDPYQALNPFHLWRDVFHVFQLNEIMRQKDDDGFAALLNRIRIDAVPDDDAATLQSRIISSMDKNYPHDVLHVFSTNRLVDEHNLKMLGTLKSQLVTLIAVDSKKDTHTNLATVSIMPDDPSLSCGLITSLTLAIGAKVMLTRNIDVADGLVNGAQGSVVSFKHINDNREEPIATVWVKFDSPSVGQHHRRTFPCAIPGAVLISHQESRCYYIGTVPFKCVVNSFH